MNAQTISIVAARGLSLFFLVNGVSQLTNAAYFMFFARPGYSDYLLPLIVVGSLYLLGAGFLWRNAAHFGGPASDGEQVEPLTSNSALRVALTGISTYFLFAHLPSATEYGWDVLKGKQDWEGAAGPYNLYTRGSLLTFGVALVTLLALWKGAAVKRMLTYPPYEQPFDDEPPPKS